MAGLSSPLMFLFLALLLLNAGLLLWLALRTPPAPNVAPQIPPVLQPLLQPLFQSLLTRLQADNQGLRTELSQQQHQQRSELG